jgi:gluconokinase
VLLEPSLQELEQRVAERAAGGQHYMPPSLLPSQLAALQYEGQELAAHFRPQASTGRMAPPQEIAEAIAQLVL